MPLFKVTAAFEVFKEQMEAKYALLSAFVSEFLRAGPNAKATPANVYTLWFTGVPKKVFERPDLGIFFFMGIAYIWH